MSAGVLKSDLEKSTMGVFRVPVRMSNMLNPYLPEAERGEDVECEMTVDTGAANLAIPAELVEKLRLKPLDTAVVRTADGARHEYRICGIVELEVQGRKCQVRAIELPRGARPLLGAIPLEEMDWHVSPLEGKLLPNPESPDRALLPLL
ncbi:MAG: retroviral-like aspartic protease family protein [Thermoguttaceae bacterium]